jgi:hypothetical protein
MMTRVGVDARVAGRFLVLANREEMPSEDRAVKKEPGEDGHDRRNAIVECGTPPVRPEIKPFEHRKIVDPKEKPAVPSLV